MKQHLLAFATGLTVALTAVFVFHGWNASATPGDTDTTFVPLTPCRLVDTRPAPARVGVNDGFTAGETKTFNAHGTHGECTVPADASALSLNMTALNATSTTFFTVWPEGSRPTASSLNPSPGEPPTPNAVVAPLSPSGTFNVYNEAGSVGLVVDVNGYYTKASLEELASQVGVLQQAVALALAESPFTVSSENLATKLSTIAQSVTSVTIDSAPVDGQVTVVATANAYDSQPGHITQCGLSVTPTKPLNQDLLAWESSADSEVGSIAVSRVFNLSAGNSHEFHLMCLSDAGNDAYIYTARLHATFTPER